jgi:hypothetical protein
MRRFTCPIASSIIAILLLGAVHCSAATASSADLAKLRRPVPSIQASANAAPPPGVLKCPPLPKWILDQKLLAKPLQQNMLYSTFPPKVDYSQYITLTRCQDGAGGCFLYAALAVIDILKEREHPYTPDLSYRYAQYYYDNKHVDQKKVHTDYGSCPEACLHSDYDAQVWAGDHFDDTNCPHPTPQDDAQARRYRIQDTSDPVTPAVSALKSLLVSKGPLWAAGTVEGVAHCFAIVGYDDSQNAFRFINSWGDGWNGNGYGCIPYAQVSQMLDHVTYFTNRASERVGTPDAFTARIRIRHDNLRNELRVAVGVEGMQPMIIWDRPNQTGPPQDWNKNLDIDVPLPSYAASHWPPSPSNLWYVQVTDGVRNGKAPVVHEVTLARLMKSASGKYTTEVHRPRMATYSVPDGGSRKIYVGAQPPKIELTLAPNPAAISSGGSVVLSGLLSFTSFDTDAPAATPIAGKQIKINSIISSSDTVEQSQWQQTGTATTAPNGTFSLTVSPSATTTYVAAYTRPDGQIIASSSKCQVTVGAQQKAPVRRPSVPIVRPH